MKSRLVIAKIRVSRFSKDVSRVLRISAGEKRLKMSSVDSGSSQNYEYRLIQWLNMLSMNLQMPNRDRPLGSLYLPRA